MTYFSSIFGRRFFRLNIDRRAAPEYVLCKLNPNWKANEHFLRGKMQCSWILMA